MRRRRNRVAASLLLAAAISVLPGTGFSSPEHDRKFLQSEGCVALGTHSVSYSTVRPWDCYFRATGPSMFVAATTNPYVINVSRDNGKTWIEIARRSVPGPPTAGFLATRTGDRVGVSLSCWDYAAARPCGASAAGGRFGTIVVHSEI